MRHRFIVFLLFLLLQPFYLSSADYHFKQLNRILMQMSAESYFSADEFRQIISDASPAEQFTLYAKLRSYYCEQYLSDNDAIPDAENLINSYFTFDNRLGYFIFCTERRLFNAYTSSEFEFFSGNAAEQYDTLHYALDLYKGLYLYTHNCAKQTCSEDDYAQCSDLLDKALGYRPNDALYPILAECLAKAQRYERLFWLECYRHYDRNNDSLMQTVRLYRLYKKIANPDKKFFQFCEQIKAAVLSDTVKRFITAAEDTAGNQQNNEIISSFIADITAQTDNHQVMTSNNNNTIVLLFSVTCHNCTDEMDVLSKMIRDGRLSHINVIGIYTMYNDKQTAADELKLFQSKHNYPFPTAADIDRNSISSRYGITSVPSMLLFRNGSIIGAGSFGHYGHLQDKFQSLFHLFD